MDGIDVARELAGDGSVLPVGVGRHRVFRVWGTGPTRLIKVYPSAAAHERETRALQVLQGIPGVPTVLATGSLADRPWSAFPDPGTSTLATLPDSRELGLQAGRLMAAVHRRSELPAGGGGVVDARWVRADYATVFSRLARYRGRLRIPPDLLEAAAGLPPPKASPPVTSHTDPLPELFHVGETGRVTLFHWDAVLAAPPEWDYTRARWCLRIRVGPATAAGFADGYGEAFDRRRVEHWTVYHAGMLLLRLAEDLDADPAQAAPLLAGLEAAVWASRRSLI